MSVPRMPVMTNSPHASRLSLSPRHWFRGLRGGAGSARAAARAVEALEDRRLFTTIGPDSEFVYTTLTGESIIITTGPDVTAELLGSTPGAGGATVTNLAGLLDGTPVNGGPAVQQDLYAIYVSESTIDSYITVIAARGEDQNPFAGAIEPLAITNTEGESITEGEDGQPITISPGADTGLAYLGARVATPGGGAGGGGGGSFRPIVTGTANQPFGALAPGPLAPGFYVEDGNDFGRFIFDGVVTGQVDVGGSMDTFYCGWLLTGETPGVPGLFVERPDNFVVDGDIRNIISVDSIGTETLTGNGDPRYSSGFDLQVGGRLGNVTTRDAFVGKIDVVNEINFVGLRTAYRESEFVVPPQPAGGGISGNLEDEIPTQAVRNDTFDTPQVLGSFLTTLPGLGEEYIAQVDGRLQATPRLQDAADYYGVPLMAGERLIVDIQAGFDFDFDGVIEEDEREVTAGVVNLAIFDPDGRLVATDYNNADLAATAGQAFGYTADRPGLYRVAVAAFDNTDFTGPGRNVGTVDYTITVRGVGELGVGGLVTTNNLWDLAALDDTDPFPGGGFSPPAEASLRLRRADFGAIHVGPAGTGEFNSDTFRTIGVDNGNLRAIEARAIGTPRNTFYQSVALEIPNGSVGLVRATGDEAVEQPEPPPGGGPVEPPVPTGASGPLSIVNARDEERNYIPLGRNIQVISSGGQFAPLLRVNGGIGVIRCGDFGPATQPELFVDFDRTGNDGIIDLIDVEGNLGSIRAGGPAIDTGVGGNVRYMSVGGDIYVDRFFGTGEFSPIEFQVGESTIINDDSGSRIRLTPVGDIIRNPDFDPGLPEDDTTNPRRFGPRLALTTYGIRSGGNVLVDVTSTGGIQVEGLGTGYAEIGRIQVQGEGRAVVTRGSLDDDDDDGPTRGDPDELVLEPLEEPDPADPDAPTGPQNLDVVIAGDINVDVFEVIVSESLGIGEPGEEPPDDDDGGQGELEPTGNATAIRNETGGELVNVSAASVGDLYSRGLLGLSKNHTGAALVRAETLELGDTFPFLGQTTGIDVRGNILIAHSDQGLGNILARGSIGDVIANEDRSDDNNLFEGINGPVVAISGEDDGGGGGGGGGGGDGEAVTGRIFRVNIGDGILPSGSGNLGAAGIYAQGEINSVTNQGPQSDIRGDIVSERGIGRITLNDGALINADVMVVSDLDMSREITRTFQIVRSLESITNPEYELEGIQISGRGGILSSQIMASDIGPIQINGGFGFINSFLTTLPSTRVEGVQTDGYGIRDSEVGLGASGGSVVARGDGASVSVLNYTPSVRFSERTVNEPAFLDPFFVIAPTSLTDLYLALGLAPGQPEATGITDTGVIEDVEILGNGDLGNVSAYTIRGRDFDEFVFDEDDELARRESAPMQINVSNSLGNLTTRGPINGMVLTAGRFGNFAPGSHVFNSDIRVSGPVARMRINGQFAEDSRISLTGPNGRMRTLLVEGDLIGDISSAGQIGSITILGQTAGSITASVGGGRRLAISSITFNGIAPGAELTVNGNVGKITSTTNLGGAGQRLTVNGSAKLIKVNGNLAAIVNVTDDLAQLNVRDTILNSIVTVGDILGTIRVGGDISEDSVVTARVLKRQQIRGQVFGEIVITG